MEPKDVAKFIFELGMLRRVKHEGWRHVGVSEPESVADHSLRAAQIGFLLAKLEGYGNPQEVATMLVFHDVGECRIGDIHRIAARYVKADEESAVADQTKPLGDAGKEILDLWKQTDERSSTAGNIAKDADLLEQAFTAREYIELGHKFAQSWVDRIGAAIKTKSAKEVFALLKNMDSNDWWKDLKKIE